MPSADDTLESTTSTPADLVRLKTEPAAPPNSVRPFEALTTAQAIFSDKSIAKIEVISDSGMVVYSVRFSDDSHVDVNASNGVVVYQEDAATNTNLAAVTSISDTTTLPLTPEPSTPVDLA
jgi:hypothetical protein